MFSQFQDKLDDEFERPVESIMRCEDFKSNFARRLSNRYTSRSPVSSPRQDNVLKLSASANKQEVLNNVPERIEPCSQLSKSNSYILKSADMAGKNDADMRRTEVNVLNMEVETLRWQLSQTEANRQMHIALLQQIVTFLNRVKEHIESQKTEAAGKLNTTSPMVTAESLNKTDLLRSRSVFHVSKNLDYAPSPTKKMSTKKISKSINNVNGYKDCSNFWGQSRLSLVPEDVTGEKLIEEMSRLITLANTVLSTKLPDLSCSHVVGRVESSLPQTKTVNTEQTDVQIITPLDVSEKNVADNVALNTNCINETCNGITSEIEDVNPRILRECCEFENKFSALKLFDQEHTSSENAFAPLCGKVIQKIDKRNEYNVSSNFIEDESGFSSMSSFQEIGIPIISIIPPSPSKQGEYLEEISDETEKWKTDAIELDKQSVKVFWV